MTDAAKIVIHNQATELKTTTDEKTGKVLVESADGKRLLGVMDLADGKQNDVTLEPGSKVMMPSDSGMLKTVSNDRIIFKLPDDNQASYTVHKTEVYTPEGPDTLYKVVAFILRDSKGEIVSGALYSSGIRQPDVPDPLVMTSDNVTQAANPSNEEADSKNGLSQARLIYLSATGKGPSIPDNLQQLVRAISVSAQSLTDEQTEALKQAIEKAEAGKAERSPAK